MAWFRRKSAGILTDASQRNEAPEGYWRKDPATDQLISLRELQESAMVAPSGHHFPMSGLGYCELLFDEAAFTPHDADLYAGDPLHFKDRKAYPDRVAEARQKSGLNDAIVSATGTVGGHKLSLAAMDFTFIGGSMGSVVGEVISRAVKRAIAEERALLVISQSGGARMMEGAFSLMQMAKISAHLAALREARLPYFSLMTNPTTGGVTASFAMLGDLNLAEPGALIGFAGPRVIRETIGRDLPKDFQTAEFLLQKGFIDTIVPRPTLRRTLIQLLDLLLDPQTTADAPTAAAS